MKKIFYISVILINIVSLSFSQSVFENLGDKFSKHDELSIVDTYLSHNNTIGIVDSYLSSSNTYSFQDNPSRSDIIIVIDFELMSKFFSSYSFYKKLVDNFHFHSDFNKVDKSEIQDVYDNKFIFLSNGKVYEITSYVYRLWSSYDDVYIIDDEKMIYDGEEFDIKEINNNNIDRTSIRKISDYPHYIYLSNGTVYYTNEIDPILWLEYSSVIVINKRYMIYEPLDDIISVTRVR